VEIVLGVRGKAQIESSLPEVLRRRLAHVRHRRTRRPLPFDQSGGHPNSMMRWTGRLSGMG
jgi:hypothetical protein